MLINSEHSYYCYKQGILTYYLLGPREKSNPQHRINQLNVHRSTQLRATLSAEEIPVHDKQLNCISARLDYKR